METLFPEETTKAQVDGPFKNTKDAPTITKEEAEDYATSLYEAMKGFGADGKAVDAILLNGELNSYDIVTIMEVYGKASKGNYLARDIASNFIGKHKENLLEKLMNACIEVYLNETPENRHLHHRARVAMDEKTLKDFMVKKGMAEPEGNISISTLTTGSRG